MSGDHVMNEDPPLKGTFETDFAAVANAFERNFHEEGEIGASVCVFKDGQKVVDLWGGYSDGRRTGRGNGTRW